MSYEKVAQFRTQLIIGTKQTIKAMTNGEVSEVFIAKDVDRHITAEVFDTAERLDIPCTIVDSKKQLGKACDIEVDASVAAIKHE